MKLFTNILKYSLSLLFLVSAISKIGYMDEFELFIYDLTNIGYNQANLLTRAFIGLELVISFLFLYRQFSKLVFTIAFFLTIGFSVFLFQHLDLKNCFCFGPNFPFSAKDSLWKNFAIIIGLVAYLILELRSRSKGILIPKMYAMIIATLLFLLPAIINIPSSLTNILNVEKIGLKKYQIKDQQYQSEISSVLKELKIDATENQIIPIISSQCKYCKASMGLLKSFDKRYQLKANTTLFIIGDSLITKSFIKMNLNNEFKYLEMNVAQFMKISKGVIPQFLLIKDQSFYILKSRNLSDQIFIDWLK